MELNHDEIRRYSRHRILPEAALAGQKKIKAASLTFPDLNDWFDRLH
jgi:molybdopterin/thiamine biosynthesis adenylyltransferase